MGSKKNIIYTRLDDDTLKIMDNIISNNKHFDSRSHFVRSAVIDALQKYDKHIIIP